MSEAPAQLISRIVAGTALLLSLPAQAADTVETFDVGVTDVELYTGLDGIGQYTSAQTPGAEMTLGIGITPALSAFVGTTLEADGNFRNGSAGLYFGLFGTPVDTDHVDFDLVLDVSAASTGLRQFMVAPGFELNVDLVPDLALWGVYLRGNLPMGAGATCGAADGNPSHALGVDIETVLGTYFTVAEGHQVLLEYDMAFAPAVGAGAPAVVVGGLALGYNVGLSDSLEFIAQVHLDLAQAGETTAVGLSAGIIGTLPWRE